MLRWLIIFLLGVEAGVAGAILVGFYFLDWTTEQAARVQAERAADQAVAAMLRPICNDALASRVEPKAVKVEGVKSTTVEQSIVDAGGMAVRLDSASSKALASACASLGGK